MKANKKSLGARFTKVTMPIFASEAKGAAIAGLVVLVGLMLAVNGINVVNSYVGADFFTSLEQRRLERFYTMAAMLAAVFFVASLAEALLRYTEQRLGILWREWLTRKLLDRYLSGRTYRRIAAHGEVDNPDQRLSEDVKTFTSTTLAFFILGFNAGLTLIAFASILCSITPWLLAAAAGYALLGSLGTGLLGWRLVGLDYQQLRREADFRFELAQFRHQADTVAEIRGEAEEKARLGLRIAEIVKNFRAIIRVNLRLSFFTSGYNYLPQIIPAAIVAPLYIRGEVPFGKVTQAAMAFSQVLAAFSLFVSQFQQLSAFAAVIGRIGLLWEATEPLPEHEPARAEAAHAAAAPHATRAEAPRTRKVAYECLTLQTPSTGRLLVHGLSLEVPEGKRLLVTGPTGAGKTALCLATAGLWRPTEGRVVLPDPAEVMFLPRRPYLPAGRLRDVLLYALDRPAVEGRLGDVLIELELDELVRRAGGLDAERGWESVLSEGEQEKLAFARLVLAQPPFAFLDNALGSTDEATAERLYGALARTQVTYVSVGRWPFLPAYHDFRLELLGDGEWQMAPAEQPAGRREVLASSLG
jgi:putative ATP-binding cassette transporter